MLIDMTKWHGQRLILASDKQEHRDGYFIVQSEQE